MITGSGVLAVATILGPLGAAASLEDSCLGVPLRAESAAKGETKFWRAG